MAGKKTPTRRFIFPKKKPLPYGDNPKRQFKFPWDKKGAKVASKAVRTPLKKISRRMK